MGFDLFHLFEHLPSKWGEWGGAWGEKERDRDRLIEQETYRETGRGTESKIRALRKKEASRLWEGKQEAEKKKTKHLTM